MVIAGARLSNSHFSLSFLPDQYQLACPTGEITELLSLPQVCLVHDPRETSPYGRLYTVEYLNNMVGGVKVLYINQPIDVLKALAAKSIKNNQVGLLRMTGGLRDPWLPARTLQNQVL